MTHIQHLESKDATEVEPLHLAQSIRSSRTLFATSPRAADREESIGFEAHEKIAASMGRVRERRIFQIHQRGEPVRTKEAFVHVGSTFCVKVDAKRRIAYYMTNTHVAVKFENSLDAIHHTTNDGSGRRPAFRDMRVTLPNGSERAVIGRFACLDSYYRDVALLAVQLEAGDTLPAPVEFDTSPLRIQQRVFAAGSPASQETWFSDGKVTRTAKGETSNNNGTLDTEIQADEFLQQEWAKGVGVNVSIAPGSSGGVLANDRGQVSGVVGHIDGYPTILPVIIQAKDVVIFAKHAEFYIGLQSISDRSHESVQAITNDTDSEKYVEELLTGVHQLLQVTYSSTSDRTRAARELFADESVRTVMRRAILAMNVKLQLRRLNAAYMAKFGTYGAKALFSPQEIEANRTQRQALLVPASPEQLAQIEEEEIKKGKEAS